MREGNIVRGVREIERETRDFVKYEIYQNGYNTYGSFVQI